MKVGEFVKNSYKAFDYRLEWQDMVRADQSIVFFLRGPFSNWFPRQFYDKNWNIHLDNVEQWMMAKKADLFQDWETRGKILRTTSPSEVKKLGRKVKNYNDGEWAKIRYQVVYDGNWLKFTQHKDLKKILLDTGNSVLAEANPKDNIWGIGMDSTDPNRFNQKAWGQNLLGKVLMEIRQKLK